MAVSRGNCRSGGFGGRFSWAGEEAIMPSRRGLLRLALLFALPRSLPASANGNKLLNPGFDGGTTHWALASGGVVNPIFTTTYASGAGHYGPGALGVVATGTATIYNVIATQIVNVNPGTMYSFGTYF